MSDEFKQKPLRLNGEGTGRIEDIAGSAVERTQREDRRAYVNPDDTPLGRERGGVSFGGEQHVRPSLPEIERGVLWAVMNDPERNAVEAVDLLKPEAFDGFENRLIYTAAAECVESGEMPTLAAVVARLRTRGADRAINRAFEISDGEQRSLDVGYHCLLLLSQQVKRDQIALATKIGGAALDPSVDALELQDQIEQEVFGIIPDIARKHIVTPDQVTGDVLDQYRENADNDGGLIGISRGYALLD